MNDFDLEKIAEAIPQTIVDFIEDYFSQYDALDENHPDFDTLMEIAMLYLVYEEGEKYALLQALKLSCKLKQSAIPNWVAQRVHKKLIKWLELDVKTLDNAFEVERPGGFRLKAEKKSHMTAPQIYSRITNLSKSGRAKDDNLFDEVGIEYGIGKTLAKKYYYEYKRLLDAALAPGKRFLK